MFKQNRNSKGEKGFTLIELLVVAAIIGILLALAIPNLLKARISANEANAAKMMQTLRDAEGEYFEQDLDNNLARDYTDAIGDVGIPGTAGTLRDPDGNGVDELDALVDSSFVAADEAGGAAGGQGSLGDACATAKAGYCIAYDSANAPIQNGQFQNFGWTASMVSFNRTGRRNYAVYGDGVIRCAPETTATSGLPGNYEADITSPGCQ